MSTRNSNRRQVIGYVDKGLDRKARRALERQLAAERRRESAIAVEGPEGVERDLPVVVRGAKHGPTAGAAAGGFRSTIRVRQPGHRLSSVEAAGIYPFLTGTRMAPLGGALGIDRETQDLWCFDPWRWYETGRIPSTGVVIMGGYRQGKSFFLKRLISMCVALGRQAINTSDSKGEHGRLALALGGTVFRVGAPGSDLRINPLDAGTKPVSMPQELWDLNVRQRRSLLLQQIAEILLGGGARLSPEERTALEWALEVADAESGGTPTLRRIYQNLGDLNDGRRSAAETGDIADQARRMWHTLRRLVVGDLAGMFEDESTIQLDADCPYTVFDTYSMALRGDDALAITQAVTQSWVQTILQDKESGRKFLVAREEGWRDMNSAAALESQRLQQKLAGEFGICQLLVVHEGGDFEAVGHAGSKERELAEQLAKGFAVKISFAQERGQLAASARAVGLTAAQADMIGSLAKGQCVVAIGDRSTLVDTWPLSTAWELDLFNTDAAMLDRKIVEEELEEGTDEAEPVPPPVLDIDVHTAPLTLPEPVPATSDSDELHVAARTGAGLVPAITVVRDDTAAGPAPAASGGIGSVLDDLDPDPRSLIDDIPTRRPARRSRTALVAGAAAAVAVAAIGAPALAAVLRAEDAGAEVVAEWEQRLESWSGTWSQERIDLVVGPDPAVALPAGDAAWALTSGQRETFATECAQLAPAREALDELAAVPFPQLPAGDVGESEALDAAMGHEDDLAGLAAASTEFLVTSTARLDTMAVACGAIGPLAETHAEFEQHVAQTMPATRTVPDGSSVDAGSGVEFPCTDPAGCVDLLTPATRTQYADALETTYVEYFGALGEQLPASGLPGPIANAGERYTEVADAFATVVEHLRTTEPTIDPEQPLYPQLGPLMAAANEKLIDVEADLLDAWRTLDPAIETLTGTGASLAGLIDEHRPDQAGAATTLADDRCKLTKDGCE